MQQYKKLPKGFNLIELVITLSIVGILGAIAIPSYIDYNRRTYFSSMQEIISPCKEAVIVCFETTKKIKGCNGGTHKIPNNLLTPKGNIASLTIENGMITVIPVKKSGILPDDTYVLTPVIANKTITWKLSGGAVQKGYVDTPS